MSEATGTVRKDRDEAIKAEDFVTAFITGVKAGESAAQIGLRFNPPKNAAYVSARSSKMRTEGLALPTLDHAGRPKSDPTKVLEAIAALRGMKLEEVIAEGVANKAASEARKAEKAAG